MKIYTIKTRKKDYTITPDEIEGCDTLEIISKSLKNIKSEENLSIKTLRIYCPELEEVDEKITQSENLLEIKIKENNHARLILESFEKLKNLNSISLSSMKLNEIPNFIKSSLLTLEVLDLSKNNISNLPSFLANASEITNKKSFIFICHRLLKLNLNIKSSWSTSFLTKSNKLIRELVFITISI